MRVATAIWILLFAFLGFRGADFVNRILSPDFVAVAFSEGGDDAYYYFTVARNIAGGYGATIDQAHWTSGFQPLWVLLDSIAFLTHSDRAALAVVYLASFGLWLVSAMLLVRFIRRASTTPMDRTGTALVVTLFLCERQLNTTYFNGMETGLFCTLVLWLMTAFQDYFLSLPSDADRLRAVKLGLLAGLVMLARNDGVFLCGCLIAMALFGTKRPHRYWEAMIVIITGSCLVVPWLVYCQWVAGYPIPQSGIATSSSIRDVPYIVWSAQSFIESFVPIVLVKTQTLIDKHVLAAGVVAFIAIASIVGVTLSYRLLFLDRGSRHILLALAISGVALLVYYSNFSLAYYFYERYFVPIKLLVVILLSLVLVRVISWIKPRIVSNGLTLAVATAAVCSNAYWISSGYGRPLSGHFGLEAFKIARSPYASGVARLGLMESGRLGFLFPSRVVNLDGKVNVDALHALQNDTLALYLQTANLDYIMLRGIDVTFFDKRLPAWRESYSSVGTLGGLIVFARSPIAR